MAAEDRVAGTRISKASEIVQHVARVKYRPQCKCIIGLLVGRQVDHSFSKPCCLLVQSHDVVGTVALMQQYRTPQGTAEIVTEVGETDLSVRIRVVVRFVTEVVADDLHRATGSSVGGVVGSNVNVVQNVV